MSTRGLLVLFLWLCSTLSGLAQTAFFVAPGGNDTNPGTKQAPFATSQRARDAIRELKKKGAQKQAVQVFFREGIYPFSTSFGLDSQDAGTKEAPITYQAYIGEKVIFNGGKSLSSSAFKPVADPGTLSRLPETARTHVLEIDLNAQGITDFGKRAQHGFSTPVQQAPLELFVDGKPLPLARYPNDGQLKIGTVIDPGSKPREGDTSNRGATFEFDYDRAKRWQQADNAWIYGMFAYGYADDNLKIDRIDLDKKQIKLVQPHLYSVFSSVDTSSGPLKHAKHLRAYYVYNLLEEIDQAGEWFLDEKTGKLYLYPPVDFAKVTIDVSMLEDPFLLLQNTAYLRFKNITFTCARGMGVYSKNVQSCGFEQCVFSNLGTVAISMGPTLSKNKIPEWLSKSMTASDISKQGSHDFLVDRCTVFNTGTGGIALEGGDRKTLTAGNNIVQNCEFHEFSRLNRTYSPGVRITGVGNVVRHCYFHDAPHEAIEFMGNDHLIEYNHFKHLCYNAADMGAIYIGRNPSARGTMIRYNFFDEVNSEDNNSMCAIYFDDGTSGNEASSNVFYKSGKLGGYQFGAFWVHGGYDNQFNNNVFIDCAKGYGNTPWTEKLWADFLATPLQKVRLREEVDITSDLYLKHYPALKTFFDLTQPHKNYVRNTLFVGTGILGVGRDYVFSDTYMTRHDPGFVNSEKKDFRLKPDAEVFKKLPQFQPIPFEKIGIEPLPDGRLTSKSR